MQCESLSHCRGVGNNSGDLKCFMPDCCNPHGLITLYSKMALIYCFLTTMAQDTLLWGILASYKKADFMKTRDPYQSTTYFYFSRDQVRVLYEYHDTIKQLIPWPREFQIQFPNFEFEVKNTLSECHEADLFCICHSIVWLFWLRNGTKTRREA